METKVYNQLGEVVGNADLPASIFDVAMSLDVVTLAVQAQAANARHTIAHTKGRGEVRGGGKKPWKQKGTGRARHASIRSPIWKGGGVSFGPKKERNYSQKINKKAMRKALAMALSSKVRDNEFLMLDHVAFTDQKTKEAVAVFKNIAPHLNAYRTSKRKQDSILLVTPTKDVMVEKTIRNLPFAQVMAANSLNVRDILENKYLVLLKDAVPVIKETYKIKSK
jgi:large subunit ribosomal protein L4